MSDTTWTAEDVPAYMFSRAYRLPQTGEDAAMSAPRVLSRGVTEARARADLDAHLIKISALSSVESRGETELFQAAAAAVRLGVTGLQIHGRVYRIREED